MSTCGKPLSAECVAVDNPQFKSVVNQFCGDNVGETLRQFDKVIYSVEQKIDITKLQGQSLGIDSRTATLLGVIQILVSQVDKLNKDVAELKLQVSDINILNTPISIDGSCLSLPSCTDGSSYTVGQILTALVSKQCGGTSSSVYQPSRY